MVKIVTAPGPVSYPLILASKEYKDLELSFGKEPSKDVYAIADSTVSLIKNNLRIDVVTVRRLMLVTPYLRGPRIGIWRKGSAADIMLKIALSKQGVNAELVYADEWLSVLNLLRSGQVNSAVLTVALSDEGVYLDSLINAPGNCGAQVNGDPELFKEIYEAGIELAKEDPEGSAEYVASKLPINVGKEFIVRTLEKAEYGVFEPGDYDEFKRLVNTYA